MRESLLSKLFNNKIFLIVFSVLLASFIWLFITAEKTGNINRTVTNVGINLETKEKDRQFFVDSKTFESHKNEDGDKLVGDVEIVGLRYYLDSVKSTDIDLTYTNTVLNIGEMTLNLKAKPKEDEDNFTIGQTITPTNILVYYDAPAGADFNIDIDSSLIETENGFYYRENSAFIASDTTKLSLTGPATVINKINSVTVRPDPDQPLNVSTAVDGEFTFLDENGIEVDEALLKYVKAGNQYVTGSDFSRAVTVKIPVYREATLKSGIDFKNRPSAFSSSEDFASFRITYEPKSVFVAKDTEIEEVSDVLNIMTVNFADLRLGENIFTADAAQVEADNKCIILDETEKFTVTITIDDENLIRKVVSLTPNVIVPENSGFNVKSVTPAFNEVTLIGPEADINAINPDELRFEADLSSVEPGFKGTVTVYVNIIGNTTYWATGTYMTEVEIA